MILRGTTPTEKIKIKNNSKIDLTICSEILVTITDRTGKDFVWDLSRLSIDNENKIISVTLTQEETLAFAVGEGQMQLRFKTTAGKVFASFPPTKVVIQNVRKGGLI